VNSLTAPQKGPGGIYTAGYGYINMMPGGFNFGYVEKPRSGQLVARITF
jgi:hypothetical protein